jgi:hypothetical protein
LRLLSILTILRLFGYIYKTGMLPLSLASALRIAASISVDGIAISIALNISLLLSLGDSNNNFLYGTILDLLFCTSYLAILRTVFKEEGDHNKIEK